MTVPRTPFPENSSKASTAGTSTRAIFEMLERERIVRSRHLAYGVMRLLFRGKSLKAGEYRFDRPATPFEVVDRLARGDVFLRPITFPEGLTLREMAGTYADRGLGDASEFVRAATAQAVLVHDLDAEARDLEGYLFPETYMLPRSAGADGRGHCGHRRRPRGGRPRPLRRALRLVAVGASHLQRLPPR